MTDLSMMQLVSNVLFFIQFIGIAVLLLLVAADD